MVAKTFEIHAEVRESTGKAAARRSRRLADGVPAIVYGAGKPEQALTLAGKNILRVLKDEAAYSSILTLQVGGKKESVIIKALQRHHTKPKILHVDFQRIKATEALTMTIPLHLLGEEMCPGVHVGGVVSRPITEIEIKCFPADLPAYIEVDITEMELDQSLHLSEIVLPSGVELAVSIFDLEHDPVVVSVHVPKISSEDREPEVLETEEEVSAKGDASDEASEAAHKGGEYVKDGDEPGKGDAQS